MTHYEVDFGAGFMSRLQQKVDRYDEIELALDAIGVNLHFFIEAVVASLFELDSEPHSPNVAPYGYISVQDENGDWQLVEHPGEYAVRRLILWWKRVKGLGVTEIVNKLNEHGAPSRGQKWHRQSVYRVLANEGDLDDED